MTCHAVAGQAELTTRQGNSVKKEHFTPPDLDARKSGQMGVSVRRTSNAHARGHFAKEFYISHGKTPKTRRFSSGFVISQSEIMGDFYDMDGRLARRICPNEYQRAGEDFLRRMLQRYGFSL